MEGGDLSDEQESAKWTFQSDDGRSNVTTTTCSRLSTTDSSTAVNIRAARISLELIPSLEAAGFLPGVKHVSSFSRARSARSDHHHRKFFLSSPSSGPSHFCTLGFVPLTLIGKVLHTKNGAESSDHHHRCYLESNCSPVELVAPDAKSSSTGYRIENGDAGPLSQTSDSLIRHQFQNHPAPGKRDELKNHLLDPELVELYCRSRQQEEEILLLRKQITNACIKELQLLNEKHILERRLSELQIALDERQDDAVASALKELIKKRSYLDENLRLTDNLKVVEEDMYILTSSFLSLLAEYDIRPPVISSSAISYGIKQLYQSMHWKIRYNESAIPELRLYDQHPMDLHAAYEKPRDLSSEFHKEVGNTGVSSSSEVYAHEATFRPLNSDAQFHTGTMHDNQGSFVSEGEYDLPGIEGFQIYGEAKPGCKLQACGYPTNGTTLCIFQWVRELDNGTRQYIEGVNVPEYVVTADDVDTILAVECTPIDNNDHQGDLVRQFANNQNKITCDSEMQNEIDAYISAGKAIFTIKALVDSSNWLQTVLIVKRSIYQIKVKHSGDLVMEEKYSPDLKIKVPLGYTTQFVLTCSDGTNLPLSTDGTCQPYSLENDVRLRDIIVLTMRHFQSKVLDMKRKVKA
ncbi:hypothetical protein OPV22_001804 [Ensete ventricosum]|uniref:Uncharacterized protein n=1 Tax=Ensete ventricosum TaxID=4639 RepID=A0AAV8QER5_ENSVE|nr:hypothetical protein OPV22_001804 [Ensete ventricosum]